MVLELGLGHEASDDTICMNPGASWDVSLTPHMREMAKSAPKGRNEDQGPFPGR